MQPTHKARWTDEELVKLKKYRPFCDLDELRSLLDREVGSIEAQLKTKSWSKRHFKSALEQLLNNHNWELTTLELQNGQIRITAK